MSNWNLSSYIDQCYILNLSTSSDRYQRTFIETQLIGFDPKLITRMEGIDGRQFPDSDDRLKRSRNNDYVIFNRRKMLDCRKAQLGTSLGHKAILEDAQAKGYRTIMVLEDDNLFGTISGNPKYQVSVDPPTLKGSGEVFRETMADLPEDWIFFYLNHACWSLIPRPARHHRPVKGNIVECIGGARLMNCYLVHERGYQPILDKLQVLEPGEKGQVYPVDVLLDHLQKERFRATKKSNIYAAYPQMLACQYPSNGSSVSQNKRMSSYYVAGGFNI